jgi:large subunit ribosomal protein L25
MTQKNKTIALNERKVFGRKVKTLRKEGLVPLNLYGKDMKSIALEVEEKDFSDMYKTYGETGVMEVSVSGKKMPVLIRNVQKDPVEGNVLHADFYKVNLAEKIDAMVPVSLIGESPAEKQGKGALVQYIDEMEVEALPNEIPEKFELSVEHLIELDQALIVSDIKTDEKKVKIKNDPEQIIAKVEEIKKEETIATPTEAETQEETPAAEEPSEDKEA